MLCKARDDAESRFQQQWVDECMANGEGLAHAHDRSEFFVLNEGLRPDWWEAAELEEKEAAVRLVAEDGADLPGKFFTGVDLAVQRHSAADETCLFTIYQRPDGRRQVVEVLAGKWNGPEIVRRIIDVHQRFGSIVIVENVAAQDYILQFVREARVTVPVIPFTTGKNKSNPEFGVESVAAELAASRWVIPARAGKPLSTQVEKWIGEMLYYDPRRHTGDRLMACWFAREVARRYERRGSPVSARVIGA
jgi:hypothetical protein